jgi:hypothetical protein
MRRVCKVISWGFSEPFPTIQKWAQCSFLRTKTAEKAPFEFDLCWREMAVDRRLVCLVKELTNDQLTSGPMIGSEFDDIQLHSKARFEQSASRMDGKGSRIMVGMAALIWMRQDYRWSDRFEELTKFQRQPAQIEASFLIHAVQTNFGAAILTTEVKGRI